MNKPILLIGGAGFLGTAVAELLSKLGKPFTVLSRSKICPPELVALISSSGGLGTYVYGDSRDAELVDHLVANHADVVFLAHSNMRGVTVTDPLMELSDNIAAAVPVFSAAARHQVKVVLLSSGGTVYGHAISVPIRADHRLAPISSYGLAKLTLENCALYFARAFGLKCLILRPSNVYGPGQIPFRGQGFVATAIATVLRGGVVRVFGRPGTVRDYVYIKDIAEGIVLALEKGGGEYVYNLGSGEGFSNEDLLQRVERIVERDGVAVRCEYLAGRKEDVACNILDASEFSKMTGWRPKVSIEKGLEQTYAWLKACR